MVFDKVALAAQQREQMLAQEHEHHVAERHRRDVQQLAGILGHSVVNAPRENLAEALANPEGVRLAAIPQQAHSSTSPFERTYSWEGRFVLVPAGGEPPDFAKETRALADVAADFFAQRDRVRRITGNVELPDASRAVIEREKQRLAAELGQRLKEVDEQLPTTAMQELSHLRLSAAERQLVESALASGTEREQQELMLLRRFVRGPTGEPEPVVTLHRWTPDTPRPNREQLGPGGKVLNLAELREAVRDRAGARERYGVAALQEFVQHREPVI